MVNEHREDPSVSGDELGEEAPLAPRVASLPDADRQRLEALLHELLRDHSLRELLCKEEV